MARPWLGVITVNEEEPVLRSWASLMIWSRLEGVWNFELGGFGCVGN